MATAIQKELCVAYAFSSKKKKLRSENYAFVLVYVRVTAADFQ